jgi:hypothetical protein
MVYQYTYRGVPMPDSTAGGNIFPIPATTTRYYWGFRNFDSCLRIFYTLLLPVESIYRNLLYARRNTAHRHTPKANGNSTGTWYSRHVLEFRYQYSSVASSVLGHEVSSSELALSAPSGTSALDRCLRYTKLFNKNKTHREFCETRSLDRPLLRETKLAPTKLTAAFVETFVATLPYGKHNLLRQNLQQQLLLNPSLTGKK